MHIMKFKYNGEYDDIINLPHHVSNKHPQMSIEARSAQFAPFAALVGYDEQVKETARLTNERKEIAEGLQLMLEEKMQEIQNKIYLKPNVTITYFLPDLKKAGGKYITTTGSVKKFDKIKREIIFEDKTQINLDEIIEIIIN